MSAHGKVSDLDTFDRGAYKERLAKRQKEKHEKLAKSLEKKKEPESEALANEPKMEESSEESEGGGNA